MLQLSAHILVAVLLTPSAGPLSDAPSSIDPEVARGISLVESGEFDDAILLLEPAAKRLAFEHRQKDLARAYAYLAIAYLGLNHEQTAKAKFVEAIAADKDLNLGADQFSPPIVALFEQARRETQQIQSGSTTPPVAKKTRSAKTPLLIGAGVAAAGVGLAAASKGSSSPPATLSIGSVTLSLTVNGLTGGTLACSTGLFFVTRASNTRGSTVQLSRLDLIFTTNSPGCIAHSAEVAGVIATSLDVTTLAPGTTGVQLKQVDLAGDLCDPPRGTPGCLWQARATLTTDIGPFTADLQFVTSR